MNLTAVVERDLGPPRHLGADRVGIQSDLAGGDDQGTLGRVADELGLTVVAGADVGVVAQHCGGQSPPQRVVRGRVRLRGSGDHGDVASVAVSQPREPERPPSRHDPGGGHLVQREGAGLVRADRGGRAEGLDRRQSLDDGPLRRHPRHADGEGDGDHRRQALGDGGDRQRHGTEDGVTDLVALGQPDQEDGEHRYSGDHGQALAEAIELLLQRRLAVLGGVEQAGQPTHLGGHAGGGHHHLGPTPGEGGVHVAAVGALGEGDVAAAVRVDLDHVGGLVDRNGFTGQRRLIDRQGAGDQEPAIGGDPVPGLHDDHVAGNQLRRRELQHPAVTTNSHGDLEHLLEGGQGVVGLRLLHVAQDGVDQQDDPDDDRVL